MRISKSYGGSKTLPLSGPQGPQGSVIFCTYPTGLLGKQGKRTPPLRVHREPRFKTSKPKSTSIDCISGWPRFGWVRLRFMHGTVRTVPVFGSDGSRGEKGFSVFPYSEPSKIASTIRFQNHYAPYFSISFKVFRDYSYSFQGSSELTSITATVSFFFLQNAVTGNTLPIFCKCSYMI